MPKIKILILCLLCIISEKAYCDEIFQATIFFRNGKTVEIGKNSPIISSFQISAYDKEGSNKWHMDWDETTNAFYSIEILNPNIKSISYRGPVLITKQDGTQFTEQNIQFANFRIGSVHRVTNKFEYKEILPSRVKKIVFGRITLKMNPNTGKLFPPDYIYDPYDKTILIQTN